MMDHFYTITSRGGRYLFVRSDRQPWHGRLIRALF